MMQGRFHVDRPRDGGAPTARQQFDDGNFVDARTGQATANAPRTVELATLLTRIRAAAAQPVSGSQGPVTPVQRK